MTTIRIPCVLDKRSFDKLRQAWDEHKNVNKVIPQNLNSAQAEKLFMLVLQMLPDEFGFSLLGDLVELYDDISMELLERLFKYGDTACNVSICLKHNLNATLLELCRTSKDKNVQQHFGEKQTYPNKIP
jgi:hypothetical protein